VLCQFEDTIIAQGSGFSASIYPAATKMPRNSIGTERRHTNLAPLDTPTKTLDPSRDAYGISPAQAVFASVSALHTIIKVRSPPFP
jgi:hypothetical protein